MVKAFLTHPVTWIQRTSLFSLPLEECVCVCVVECTMQWTNNCSVIFFFSFLVTKCLGFDVTEWFNLMPNDWTITLCSLTSTWAVFYKQKQNASSFPFTRLAVLQHFKLSFKPSWLLCLFPDFNFTWMRKHYSKRTFHLKGLKIFQLLDCWRQQRSWRNVLLTRREGFLWFSRSANACTDPNWWCRELILTLKKKIQLFSNRAVGTMQVWAIHLHRPTILSCLYYDSSNCVNSVLWFLYLRSSKTPSTVCFWFI